MRMPKPWTSTHVALQPPCRTVISSTTTGRLSRPAHGEWLKSSTSWAPRVSEVCLAGGEPFIREDLRELISALSAPDALPLLSNGGLITENCCFSSLHGTLQPRPDFDRWCRPATHDACRGKGPSEAAIRPENPPAQKSGRLPATIHHHNVNELEDIAASSLRPQLPASYKFRRLLDPPRMPGGDAGRRDRAWPWRTLELNKKYQADQRCGGRWPKPDVTKMVKAAAAIGTGLSQRRPVDGCGCTSNKIVPGREGRAILQHAASGSGQYQCRLPSDIWLNHPVMNAMRTRRSISLDSFEYCRVRIHSYCTATPGWPTHHRQVDHPSPSLPAGLSEGRKERCRL